MTTEHHRGLLDTSVFIASETGRDVDEGLLPAESAISVVTVAELRAGVLAAADTTTRAQRLATLAAVEELHVIDIDISVAGEWARLRAGLTERGLRMNVNDAWIAATALAHGLAVITQDADYAAVADWSDLVVVQV